MPPMVTDAPIEAVMTAKDVASVDKMITVSETAAWLMARDNFLLLTHVRPDGDTIGSAGALALALRGIGKTAWLLENPETTPRYARFVADCVAPDGFAPEHVIAVDTASLSLMPKNAKQYEDNVALCIDHHPSNTLYAGLVCLEPTRAACGEIIYDILNAMAGGVGGRGTTVANAGTVINAAIAERLYVAISTDTGCFAYGNTTSNTLRVASLLIDAGAPHTMLNREFFRVRTHARIAIEGMLYPTLEYHLGGRVAIAPITRDMMEKSGADEDDIDNISSIPISIEGVMIGITLREMGSETDCKGSVRTTQRCNAQKICEHFGGGGHAMAAGFTSKATLREVIEELLRVLPGFLPEDAEQ
jgi:phosphoesterase RecJ-like protein